MATGNLSNAVAYAKSAWSAIGQNVQSIEIGNEPDLYVNPPTPQDYVTQQQQWADAIIGNISNFPEGPMFEASDPAVSQHYNA